MRVVAFDIAMLVRIVPLTKVLPQVAPKCTLISADAATRLLRELLAQMRENYPGYEKSETMGVQGKIGRYWFDASSDGMDRCGSATAGTLEGCWCSLWQSVETPVSMSSTFAC